MTIENKNKKEASAHIRWIVWGLFIMAIMLLFIGVSHAEAAYEDVLIASQGSNSSTWNAGYVNLTTGTFTNFPYIPTGVGTEVCGVKGNDIWYSKTSCYGAGTQNCLWRVNTTSGTSYQYTIPYATNGCSNMDFSLDGTYAMLYMSKPTANEGHIYKINLSDNAISEKFICSGAPWGEVYLLGDYFYALCIGYSDGWASFKYHLTDNTYSTVSTSNLGAASSGPENITTVSRTNDSKLEFFPKYGTYKGRLSYYDIQTGTITRATSEKTITNTDYYIPGKVGSNYFYNKIAGSYNLYRINSFSPYSETSIYAGTILSNQFIAGWQTYITESCSDGIKNQDETSIDQGGICGTCSDGILNGGESTIDQGGVCGMCTDGIKNGGETTVDYGGICGTCSDSIQNGNEQVIDQGRRCLSNFSNCKQGTKSLYSTGGTRTTTNFFAFSGATVTSATESGATAINFTAYSGDQQDRDYFILKNVYLGTDSYSNPTIYKESFNTLSGSTVSKIGRISENQVQQQELRIETNRAGNPNRFNYIKFSGVSSAVYTKGGNTNAVASVNFHTDNGDYLVYMTMKNGVAIGFLPNHLYAGSASLKFFGKDFYFSGLELGITTDYFNAVTCGNQYYTCDFRYQDPVLTPLCAASTLSGSGCIYGANVTTPVVNTNGNITTITGPACIAETSSGILSPFVPPTNITLPGGISVDVTLDGSGNIVGGTAPITDPTTISKDLQECLGSDPSIYDRLGCGYDQLMKQLDTAMSALSGQSKVISTAMQVVEKTPNKLETTTIGKTPDARDNNKLVKAGQDALDHAQNGSSGISQLYRILYYGFLTIMTVSVIAFVIYLLRGK